MVLERATVTTTKIWYTKNVTIHSDSCAIVNAMLSADLETAKTELLNQQKQIVRIELGPCKTVGMPPTGYSQSAKIIYLVDKVSGNYD